MTSRNDGCGALTIGAALRARDDQRLSEGARWNAVDLSNLQKLTIN